MEAILATTTASHPVSRHFRNRHYQHKALVATVATLTLFSSRYADAANWTVKPTLALSESYTDNLRLAPAATQVSDYITEVSPGVAIVGKGGSLDFLLNYSIQNLAYARQTDKVTTNHLLNADANAELLKNLFFLDGSASITQQNVLPFGPQAIDNRNLTDNRTEVKTHRLSPYFRHRFGSTASGELRYSQDTVSRAGRGLQSTDTDNVLFTLDSGSAFRNVGWGVRYDRKDMDYSNSLPVSMESTSANLSYLVLPRVRLVVNGGYEKNSYVSLGEKPQGSMWSTGFSWQPSARTSISASTGHRYYGKTYSLSTNHRTRRSVWSIGYSEDITTTQSQFMLQPTTDTSAFLNNLWMTSVPDPEVRQAMVDSFIRDSGLPGALAEGINTFSNRVFLQKRLQASVALNGAKNTVVFSVFNSRREALSPGDVDIPLLGTNNTALTDDVKQTGANVVWTWRMSPRTNLSVNTNYSESESITVDRTDTNKSLRIAMTRHFQPKLRGTLEVRRVDQDSSQIGDYRENAVTASLTMTF